MEYRAEYAVDLAKRKLVEAYEKEGQETKRADDFSPAEKGNTNLSVM